jgi:hypothetical protein
MLALEAGEELNLPPPCNLMPPENETPSDEVEAAQTRRRIRPPEKPCMPLETIRANAAARMQKWGLDDPQKRQEYFDSNPVYERTLSEIGLSVRIANTLEEALHIRNVLELLFYKREELLAVPNVGEKSLEEVYAKLRAVGLLPKQAPPKAAEPPGEVVQRKE